MVKKGFVPRRFAYQSRKRSGKPIIGPIRTHDCRIYYPGIKSQECGGTRFLPSNLTPCGCWVSYHTLIQTLA
ncbi:hypothetical protein VN97_g13129 [Penicillium thymicola]|uniref:Uncharacterized protein n=1 Tax=Penicillium thymicola TaxID=293382 RepID=A0AAI9X1I8_PENTH|nr:hypothetical protein VN97_g13129 [Penicillium thymicola]